MWFLSDCAFLNSSPGRASCKGNETLARNPVAGIVRPVYNSRMNFLPEEA